VVIVQVDSEHVAEVFTGFGKKGVKAERVAADVWREARDYLQAEVPVGPHLADQLLLPLGIAAHQGQPSAFRTTALTDHSTTHIEILRKFLNIEIAVTEGANGNVTVALSPR
jgi:RNA 3'-terminal phosphate cyclase (ATP)